MAKEADPNDPKVIEFFLSPAFNERDI